MKYHLLIITIIFAAIAFASVALAQTCRDGCNVTNVFQGDNTLGSRGEPIIRLSASTPFTMTARAIVTRLLVRSRL